MYLRWHDRAVAYAGTTAIGRAERAASPPSLVPSRPADAALRALGGLLGTGRDFLIHGSDKPWDMEEIQGTFRTLTGGGTGAPKVIRRSHSSWIRSFEVNRDLFGLVPGTSVALLGDLSHSLAAYGLLEGLHLGLTVHLLEGLPPSDQLSRLADTGTGVIYATPTQLRLLRRSGVPCPAVRLILVGGGTLDAATKATVQKVFPGADIRVFYGAAETSFITLADADTPAGSVGRPYPGVRLSIDTGEEGELWVRSPYLFEGYAQQSATGATWRDGYVSVGEIARQDAAGNLFLVGRRNRVVQIADRTVHPEAVERVLSEHPAVRACAVLAEPDEMRGQRLLAVVEAERTEGLETELRQHCRATLQALAVPKRITIVARLPLLPSGKVDLREAERLA
jgi:long-chain acyl-CoA synthetase